MRRTTLLGTGLPRRLAALPLSTVAPANADRARPHADGHAHGQRDTVRFSTFNASLNRATAGGLAADLSDPDADTGPVRQAHNVAETIQRTRPDVLLVNEFDYDPAAVDLFRDNFLEVGHDGARPIDYPYAYVAPSNTGHPERPRPQQQRRRRSGAGGDDAFGFGLFPGQYGMVVYSKYPIDTDAVRTFQTFRWADMPGALLPDDPATPAPADWYSAGRARGLPALVQVALGRADRDRRRDRALPRLAPDAAHLRRPRGPQRPAQPRRDPLLGRLRRPDRKRAAYVYDDEGGTAGWRRGEPFVIAGDQNADPVDGDSVDHAIDQLLQPPAGPRPPAHLGRWAPRPSTRAAPT